MYTLNVPYLNLNQIHMSGQVFNWYWMTNGSYLIPYEDKSTLIRQYNDRLVVGCNDEQFYNDWFRYFTLGIDYEQLQKECCDSDYRLKRIVKKASGVRLLQYDTLQALIGFMLMNEMGYGRTREAFRSLCYILGEDYTKLIKNLGHVKLHRFPTTSRILEDQDVLRCCKLHGNEHKLVELCEYIEEGWLDIDELESLETYEEAFEYLSDFTDLIDSYVIDNVCLHSLGFSEVFPANEEMEKFIRREFSCDSDLFIEWFLSEGMMKKYAGCVNQYMNYVMRTGR